MSIIRVGLIKALPARFDLEENWNQFESLVRGAHDSGVQIWCSPEGFLDGYAAAEESCDGARLLEVAQDVGESVYIERLRHLAAEENAHIVFGFTQRLEGRCFNAALLVAPDGVTLGVYHKIHLQAHDLKYAAGTALPVFDTQLGRLGIMICADRRWPETARALRLRGAELILNPTYGMSHEANEWWMRTRSYENEVFICFAHPRVSLITDPEGDVAAKLVSNLPAALIHDVDLSLNSTRKHLDDRRPDLYGNLEPSPDY